MGLRLFLIKEAYSKGHGLRNKKSFNCFQIQYYYTIVLIMGWCYYWEKSESKNQNLRDIREAWRSTYKLYTSFIRFCQQLRSKRPKTTFVLLYRHTHKKILSFSHSCHLTVESPPSPPLTLPRRGLSIWFAWILNFAGFAVVFLIFSAAGAILTCWSLL